MASLPLSAAARTRSQRCMPSLSTTVFQPISSITVTHDMRSAYHIADRIAMLHEGRIHSVGTPAEVQASTDPILRQFIEGSSEGPLAPT